MPFKPLSCVYGKFTIPQRFVLVIMVQLALINTYNIRVVLNVAVIEMIQPEEEPDPKYDSCPEFTYEKVDIKGGTYDWPSSLRALILYAFYIGYIFSQLPGGWLADKFGARHVLGTCMIMSVVVTMFFPLSVTYGGYHAAIVLRILLGLTQGPIYPSVSSFVQSWAPASERSFLAGIAYSGGNLGAFIGNIVTGVIIKHTNSWAMAFYIWAIVATVWYIFYLFMVFSFPTTHPFITEKELEKLQKELVRDKVKFAVPWKNVFTSLPVYGILAAQIAFNYMYYTLVTDLPKYMKDILKLNIRDNTTFVGLPFLCLGISNIVFSRISDLLIKRGISKVLVRKVYTFIGIVIPAICLLLAVHIGCSRVGAITLCTVGVFFMGFFYGGAVVNINDITYHYSGTIMATNNGLVSCMGIIGPWIVGHFTSNGTLEEWQIVFWILFGLCTICCTIYIIFGSADRQSWDYPKQEEKTDS